MVSRGWTLSLYGDSGSGKTTQVGELAKHLFRTQRKKTLYHGADFGHHGSIDPLIELGIIETDDITQQDDPWIWLDNAVKGHGLTDDHGLVVFDSGTSSAEALLNAITKSKEQVGQQKTQRFKVAGSKLDIGLNNEAHYGLVQNFMLDAIWASTWLSTRGVNVLWTFGTHRGESVESEPLVGPKICGKALTPLMPKWFNYTFRIVEIPVAGGVPRHVLYLQAQMGHTGLAMSFGNARFPLDATSTLPASIEPASLVQAFELIERGKEEAKENLKRELGL